MATMLDLRGLFLRADGSLRRIELVVRSFLGSYEQPLGRLLWAGEDHDLPLVGEAAHALRGLLLEVGAVRAAAGAAALERGVAQGSFVQGPLVSTTAVQAERAVAAEVAQLQIEVEDAVRLLTVIHGIFSTEHEAPRAAQGEGGIREG
jgi:hypothetical protein